MIVIMTCCSKSKDDSIPIPVNSRFVEPSYYLNDSRLVKKLRCMRAHILRDPRACVGTKTTYAYDLYVRAGKAYKDLREKNYLEVKSALLSANVLEWFFLSGGYGIVHSLEKTKKYQATFSRNLASQTQIPYTANLWRGILSTICDSIISRFNPQWVYVFGSRDYTDFIKQTEFWKARDNVKVFESTGQNGPNWLSPRLSELLNSAISGNLDKFNTMYQRFVKQA